MPPRQLLAALLAVLSLTILLTRALVPTVPSSAPTVPSSAPKASFVSTLPMTAGATLGRVVRQHVADDRGTTLERDVAVVVGIGYVDVDDDGVGIERDRVAVRIAVLLSFSASGTSFSTTTRMKSAVSVTGSPS